MVFRASSCAAQIVKFGLPGPSRRRRSPKKSNASKKGQETHPGGFPSAPSACSCSNPPFLTRPRRRTPQESAEIAEKHKGLKSPRGRRRASGDPKSGRKKDKKPTQAVSPLRPRRAPVPIRHFLRDQEDGPHRRARRDTVVSGQTNR
jgi:hypothetical protein